MGAQVKEVIGVDHPSPTNSQEVVVKSASNELVFAVVGHVGSGTSAIATMLEKLLSADELAGGSFETEIIKARDIIIDWVSNEGHELPDSSSNKIDLVKKLQDFGDEMRESSGDYAVIAKKLVLQIRKIRAEKIGKDSDNDDPIIPDGKRRAYILDSIRHPAEVHLLRKLYQDAFVLVGVVCEEDTRLFRIERKYSNAGQSRAIDFMERDSKSDNKFGQKVSDTFHLSDYFVDNSIAKTIDEGVENDKWTIAEDLSRLIKIITHSEVVRPHLAEMAMYQAYGAKMKSACMSRQVGAALLDKNGNVISVGTNEVPLPGGGVYGEVFGEHVGRDHRCVYREIGGEKPCCSNTKEQNRIVDDLVDSIAELKDLEVGRKEKLKKEIKKTRVGGLLEFSRAVHAEMDALLSAARSGATTIGARLYVTTFPCHYCARHIVTAGVDEVQFIEPYLKSKALALHRDAITLNSDGWIPPSQAKDDEEISKAKVFFHPFTGVAPSLYKRAFLKDRELKDEDTGEFDMQNPEWGLPWHLGNISYVQLEAELKKDAQ